MSSRHNRLELSKRARTDFIAILRYTGKTWGRAQLLEYRDMIHEALERIRQTPGIGHGSADLPATHRIYLVGSHVIIYRTQADTVSVARILHQRMSLPLHV